MAKKIQLSIAEPCHENWENMTPDAQGKFCGSCQKQVVDFSDMSDRQVAAFFKNPGNGSVCGRFMTDQLDRAIDIPRKRIPWIKYFFQIAIPAFLLSIKASGQRTKGKVAVNTVTTDTTRKPMYQKMGLVAMPVRAVQDTIAKPVKQPVDYIMADTALHPPPTSPECASPVMGGVMIADPMLIDKKSIQGIVINEKGEPVPFATIETSSGMITMADENGNFTMRRKGLGGKEEWIISSVSYDTKKMIINKNYPGPLIIQLKSNVVLDDIVVTAMGVTKKTMIMGYTTALKGEITATIVQDTVAKRTDATAVIDKQFFVYPNPVPSGSSVNISLKNAEEGYYQLQLLTQSGQLVRQHEIWIDAEAGLMDIQIPLVAAGSYFMVLSNKKTGKKFSEKIIIQ